MHFGRGLRVGSEDVKIATCTSRPLTVSQMMTRLIRNFRFIKLSHSPETQIFKGRCSFTTFSGNCMALFFFKSEYNECWQTHVDTLHLLM